MQFDKAKVFQYTDYEVFLSNYKGLVNDSMANSH